MVEFALLDLDGSKGNELKGNLKWFFEKHYLAFKKAVKESLSYALDLIEVSFMFISFFFKRFPE